MSGRSSNDRCRLSVNAFILSPLRILHFSLKHKDLVVHTMFCTRYRSDPTERQMPRIKASNIISNNMLADNLSRYLFV